MKKKTTLPTDSAERKEYPLLSGCLKYFPAAIAGVAHISKLGNDKHNPGQALHHARNKSTDHGDCITRHLLDTEDLLAAHGRGENVTPEEILVEASQLAWRALAYSQMLHEKFGSPLAPSAKIEVQYASDSQFKEAAVKVMEEHKHTFEKLAKHDTSEIPSDGTNFYDKKSGAW